MTPRRKSQLALVGTLLLGMVLGALLVGAVGQWQAGRRADMRDPMGFVREMEHLIRPVDEAQREAIRPILEATARQNAALSQEANAALRAELNTMIEALTGHLDESQIERLRRFERRPPPPGGGRPPR